MGQTCIYLPYSSTQISLVVEEGDKSAGVKTGKYVLIKCWKGESWTLNRCKKLGEYISYRKWYRDMMVQSQVEASVSTLKRSDQRYPDPHLQN